VTEIDQRHELEHLARRINHEHRAFLGTLRSTLEQGISVGALLYAAKARCPHGTWIPWLQANFEGSVRSAQEYLRLFNHRVELREKARDSAHLSVSGALKELTPQGQMLEPAHEAEEESRPPAAQGEEHPYKEPYIAAIDRPLKTMENALGRLSKNTGYDAMGSLGYFARVSDEDRAALARRFRRWCYKFGGMAQEVYEAEGPPMEALEWAPFADLDDVIQGFPPAALELVCMVQTLTIVWIRCMERFEEYGGWDEAAFWMDDKHLGIAEHALATLAAKVEEARAEISARADTSS
jgi:Protein of unknown function (DUF3102)